MRYVIITPAYNEEGFIERTIRCVTEQTLLPVGYIVVNDGSTDATPEIVATWSRRFPWIHLVNNEQKEGHSGGAKVVRAFYLGFRTVQPDFDLLVKLDADLEFPPDTFARLAKLFEENPKLGMASGTFLIYRGGEWVYEHFADRDHVRGALKCYRRECFEAIGGLRPSIGWDTVDELLANYYGWQSQTIGDLYIKHHRETGAETGLLRVKTRIGYAMYRMRYGFWITLISAVKAGILNKPYILSGLGILKGWLEACLRKDEFIVTQEEGKFIRAFRWRRMWSKLPFAAEKKRESRQKSTS